MQSSPPAHTSSAYQRPGRAGSRINATGRSNDGHGRRSHLVCASNSESGISSALAYFSSLWTRWMLYLGRLLLLFDRAELREQGEKIS